MRALVAELKLLADRLRAGGGAAKIEKTSAPFLSNIVGMSEPNPFRFRPIRAADVPAAMPLLEQERVLYRPGTWARIPELLQQLLQRARIRGMVIEEVGSRRLRFVGLSGFAAAESLGPAIEGDLSLPDALIAGGGLLPPSRVAAANAARNLHLVSLGACPDIADYTEPEGHRLHSAMYEAFGYLHHGYGLSSMCVETAAPEILAFTQGMGMTVVRERAGGRSYVLRNTAEQARRNPTCMYGPFFRFASARLRLTKQQQQVLELALLDLADHELQEWLGLSDEALKKRWHSAYARVRKSDPDLLPSGIPGADQRRVLLGYLRQHPEELRPIPSRCFPPPGETIDSITAVP